MHRMNVMIRLARLVQPRHAERGAVATIVAAMLGGGVVLGFAALSMDVGSLMWERRQLQAGADAAALALAQTCATDRAKCSAVDPQTTTILSQLNDRNNYKDGMGGFDSSVYPNGLCGTYDATTSPASLPTCASAATGLVDCPAVPSALPAGVPYVEVHTKTKESDGTTVLPTWLARTLVGGSTGTSVGACARAAWGTPGGNSKAELPITVSACDWQHATGGTTGGGGGAYYPAPLYNGSNAYGYGGSGQPAWPAAAATPPAQNPGGEVILMLQNPPGGATMPSPCPNWQGHALPGGFGSLETTADPCEVKSYDFHWMHTNPGSSISCDLSTRVGTVVNLPVFNCTSDYLPANDNIPPAGGDCTQGNGSNGWYHRVGWAQFYLSGYAMTTTGSIANKVKSLVSNNYPCNGSESCISGWFVTGTLSATSISGPPSGSGYFGSPAVLPAG